jgi:phosphinothricin acetyltransferase
MPDPVIRRAQVHDLSALTALYNHYVIHTPITFDVEPYDEEARRPWLEQFREHGRHQLFVAEEAGRVIGYAGTMPFRPKAAYAKSVETTIYLAPDRCGEGLGERLYARLFEAMRGEDVHRLLAGITLPNDVSVALHQRLGFTEVGRFREVGHKLGRYWDVLWLDRAAHAGDESDAARRATEPPR